MPQIKLEYTSNLNPVVPVVTLLDSIHRALSAISRVDLNNCKSRVNVVDQFRVADGGADHAFVHLEVRLLEGRPEAVKHDVGSALLELLQEAFDVEQKGRRVQATVEVGDILRREYFKYPSGSSTEMPAQD